MIKSLENKEKIVANSQAIGKNFNKVIEALKRIDAKYELLELSSSLKYVTARC